MLGDENINATGPAHEPESQAAEFSRHSEMCVSRDSYREVQFIIDANRRVVIATFGEQLTAADIQGYVRSLDSHPNFDPSFSEIADISNVKELLLDASEFLKLADRTDPFSFESKRAFVAQTYLQIHAARIHKILRSQRNFGIFNSLEDAEKWISMLE